MLNPGDKCPCCGAVIPADISLENLTTLRCMDLAARRNRREITIAERDSQLAAVLEEYHKSEK